MPANQPTVVIVADSTKLGTDALARSLGQFPDISVLDEHPVDGLQAVEMVEMLRPDVLLIEYWMEGLLAPAVVRAVHAKVPNCKIIVFSWLHGTREILNCFYSGAVGFLPKSVDVEQVADAIRRSQAGETAEFRKQLDDQLKGLSEADERSSDLWGRMRQLTRRQLQILALLNAGCSLKQISDQMAVSQKTARNYMDSLLRKTGAQSQIEVLAMARTCGLIGG